jgi:hypothetical protein
MTRVQLLVTNRPQVQHHSTSPIVTDKDLGVGPNGSSCCVTPPYRGGVHNLLREGWARGGEGFNGTRTEQVDLRGRSKHGVRTE